MVMVIVVMMVMVVMVMVVDMTIQKRGLIECLEYGQFAAFCNLTLHMVTPK